MTREDPLLIDHRGAVDWLTLNRPASGNALDPALVDALVDYFEGLRDRPATRVVVLRAEGRAPAAEAEALGIAVAEDLLGQGAEAILAEVYNR